MVLGASSGIIGTETTRVLAVRGVHVIMGSGIWLLEEMSKTQHAVKEISTAIVDPMELDLSSLASVRKFASDIFQFLGPSLEPLNVRIDNKTLMADNISHLSHPSLVLVS